MNSTSLAGVPIKPATHVRDLGVMVDNDLSLQVHINHMLHELAFTICVNCESSGVLSRQTRLTPWSELLCTADSITAMEFSLVCFSTRSIGFNPFSVLQLALSLAYPSGPAFRTPCTTNYTGSPSQKGSSSNSVASFTIKCLHDSAPRYLSQYCIYRSLRSLVAHT